jgi:predicted nucleotidyltransferase
MGSEAYGVSSNDSDRDIYGMCIPPKGLVFPHLDGQILGFGRQIQRFDQWSQHHVVDKSTDPERNYDFSVYSIIKYFQLCMENNPNMIDSLFVPQRCIIHNTQIGQHMRDNRRLFLHKGAWHKFRGYAYAQMHKIKQKTNSSNEKRATDIETHGYDTKFAYHLIRLLEECRQILVEEDLNLERNSEQLKSIRRGEWTFERIENLFKDYEYNLEQYFIQSELRNKPDEDAIKKVLVECLEMHYGNLDAALTIPGKAEQTLKEIKRLVENV